MTRNELSRLRRDGRDRAQARHRPDRRVQARRIWLWNYLTFRRGRRLITGVCRSRMEAVERDGAMQEAGARSASSLIR